MVESHQLFHMCKKSKYSLVTVFVQQQLMYCLMMDQLGPKHVGVESLKILILLYIL